MRWKRDWSRILVAGWIGVAVAACGSGAEAESPPAETAVDREAVGRASLGQDPLPSALLGNAPPPRGETVHYFERDAETAGYLVTPAEGDGPFPAVILIHEWGGLNDRVRQVADVLAGEGYVALAADLYSGRTGSSRDENLALMRETQADMDLVIANLDAAAAFVREQDGVTGQVASIGWCFGGGVALSYALGGEHHDGTAIFYGSLIEDPERLASIDHELYGTFAEMDRGIPPDQVDRFVAALREAGVPNDVHVYDEVNHGFWLWVERDPAKAAGPALDAWNRLKSYLRRTLTKG